MTRMVIRHDSDGVPAVHRDGPISPMIGPSQPSESAVRVSRPSQPSESAVRVSRPSQPSDSESAVRVSRPSQQSHHSQWMMKWLSGCHCSRLRWTTRTAGRAHTLRVFAESESESGSSCATVPGPGGASESPACSSVFKLLRRAPDSTGNSLPETVSLGLTRSASRLRVTLIRPTESESQRPWPGASRGQAPLVTSASAHWHVVTASY